MEIEQREVGFMAVFCYVVACPETKEALVIDPAGDEEAVVQSAEERGLALRRPVRDHQALAGETRRADDGRLVRRRRAGQRLRGPGGGQAGGAAPPHPFLTRARPFKDTWNTSVTK